MPRRTANAQALVIVAGVLLAFWNIAIALTVGLFWLAPIAVAISLGVSRDRTGWAWGLCLGWLGVLILACMRAQRRPVK